MKMWNEKGQFDYDGCVQVGTTINYGNNDSVHVTAENYTALRSVFIGRVVEVGTSYSSPAIDSMGDWFITQLNEPGMMEYVGVILVREGYAIRESDTQIRVIR
ncbi:hypothetical protein FK216_14340 [Moraxellaceae bacterium AER2_44_116]|nr:hypothetical protein [Agitococcus sp.]TQC95390.1 hypothetical protein FK216_14340 [Moraxellaceae bacterium AER2_44_116]